MMEWSTKILALTFIGTLLSSQRTRTHHHHRETRSRPLRGNCSSLTHRSDSVKTVSVTISKGSRSATVLLLSLTSGLARRLRTTSCLSPGGGVGVRVALTRQKLRDRPALRKSAGHRPGNRDV